MNYQSQFLAGMLRVVSLLLLCAAFSPAIAQDTDLDAFGKMLKTIESDLAKPQIRQETLEKWARKIAAGRPMALDCVEKGEKKQQKLEEDLVSLGEYVSGEPADVTRKRNQVKREIKDIERDLAGCRLLVLRSEELQKSISQETKALLARQLSAKGTNIGVLLMDNWQEPALWLSASKDFIRRHSGISRLEPEDWALLAMLAVISFIAGLWLRLRLLQRARSGAWADDLAGHFSCALVSTVSHHLPWLATSSVLAISLYTMTGDVSPVPFINIALYTLPFYLLAVMVIQLFLAPHQPGVLFVNVPPLLAKQLSRRLTVLVLLAYVGVLLFYTLLAQSLPESAFLLARGVFAAILALNLIWALWLIMRLPHLSGVRAVNWLLMLVLLGALAAEWAGYRNLSVTLLRILLGTSLVIAVTVFLSRLLREFYDSLDEGTRRQTRSIRRLLGVRTGEHFPGLIWIRITTALMLWGMAALAVLRVWGASDATLKQISEWFMSGFELGSLKIVPVRILLAIVSFAVLVALAGWVRAKLESSWLSRARMERGAREALVTISGYLLIMLAILVGLGISGVDFSNLAIIAGALSVGIGFGLQNIVNNFVSGLILLFERPIKTGDWVVVGGTEGYVKRIRIRSTQIQTFDRADVIVPNSELISNQVTNWMLYDMRGRVRVPVGVAYGSDTEKVKDILLQVAAENPKVINDGTTGKPRVLFREFGDSALAFELRCYIHNIDERVRVISDLNFAIDKAFREAGIEIPFPQRDLHMRSWDADKGPPADAG
ncbi:small-conductance mechanosensitive channel [Thiogranum longum]|uniref:Small-conductance mechanosensitive channel n=1 Tax=Thiogranum longum TaxID=1537524 RepID=A0A4R1HCS2_9GAMM|nr:mechanosensitive ion channel domain-containing protein [Thiogranum longum]TCK18441.1 small-conductance mechanosensitive channel [Thiogranum longum]